MCGTSVKSINPAAGVGEEEEKEKDGGRRWIYIGQLSVRNKITTKYTLMSGVCFFGFRDGDVLIDSIDNKHKWATCDMYMRSLIDKRLCIGRTSFPSPQPYVSCWRYKLIFKYSCQIL